MAKVNCASRTQAPSRRTIISALASGQPLKLSLSIVSTINGTGSGLTLFTLCPLRRERFSSSLLFAASGCRFYCRFRLPLLVAVLRGQIVQGILLGIEEFKNLGTKAN